MDLRQLGALVAIADHGGFSAAARALHTVQSNISTHVARLERELGVTLVDRTIGPAHRGGRGRRRPGPPGPGELDALVADVASVNREVVGHRPASASSAPRPAGSPPACSRPCTDEHPRVRVVVVDATTTSLLPQLDDSQLDLAVVALPVHDADIETEPLFSEDLILVTPARPPARRAREQVTLAELARTRCCSAPRAPPSATTSTCTPPAQASSSQAKAEIDGMRLLASLAFEGFGAAVLPASAVPRWYPGDFRTVAVGGRRRDARSAWPAGAAGCRRRRLAPSVRCCSASSTSRCRCSPGSTFPTPEPATYAPRTVPESITITDNRTGESVEVPIVNGGVDADAWRKLLPNVWFYDPGFMTTAACSSAITELDGDAGILRYRGYPIEQLAEQSTYLEVAYLLLHGELPDADQFDQWSHEITYHTFIHENMRKRFMEGFHYDAHPMGMLVSGVAALSTFYPDAKDIDDPAVRHKQIVRLIAKMPTIAACSYRFSEGMPFVWPDNTLELRRELPAR